MSENVERRKPPRNCLTTSDFQECPMYNAHILTEEQIIFITMKAVELAKVELIQETKTYIDDSIPEIAEKTKQNVIDDFCVGAGRSIGRTIKDKFFLIIGIIVLSLSTGLSFHEAWQRLTT